MSVKKHEVTGFILASLSDQEILDLPLSGPPKNWAEIASDFIVKQSSWPEVQMVLKNCSRCGQCAEVCPVWKDKFEDKYWPRYQADLLTGRSGAITLKTWLNLFGACSFCKNCAFQCPLNLKPYKAVEIGIKFLISIGLGPPELLKKAANYLQFSNLDGHPLAVWQDTVDFLNKERPDIPITLGQKGCDFLLVIPLNDLLKYPKIVFGYANFFKSLNASWTLAPFEPFGYSPILPEKLADKLLEQPFDFWHSLNAKQLIWGETAVAWEQIKNHPKLSALQPRHILDLIFSNLKKLKWQKELTTANNIRAVYHYSCGLAKNFPSLDLGLKAEKILKTSGLKLLKRASLSGFSALCCGHGLYNFGEELMRPEQSKVFLQKLKDLNINLLINSSSNCREYINQKGSVFFQSEWNLELSSVMEIINQRLLV